MDRHWPWIPAVALLIAACAKESVIRTPATITVLTTERSTTSAAEAPPRGKAGRLSSDPRYLDPVFRVSSRLIAAVRQSEYHTRADDRCWAIAVQDDPARPRVFVRPDGGIVVSAGVFRLVDTEARLAAVLSHAFVHALIDPAASFPTPCVSAAQLGEQEQPLFTYQEEVQADEIGLKLMAEAGYDPRELLRLWERMRLEEQAGDEILKHFTYDRRIEHMTQRLPDALARYERANRAPQKALRPIDDHAR